MIVVRKLTQDCVVLASRIFVDIDSPEPAEVYSAGVVLYKERVSSRTQRGVVISLLM